MTVFLLFLLAVIPPVGFLIYILYMDRNEPEPVGFIILLLFFGMISTIPAALLELLIGSVLPFIASNPLAMAFIQVAPVEESIKLVVVMIFVWKNKNFNEENDGIVAVGTTALGFALAENILYVLGNINKGFEVGTMRALTSIPLHTFTGVIMGYFVGIAKFSEKSKVSNNILRGLFIAVLIHGTYDTFAFSNKVIALLIIPLVIALVIFGIIYLHKGRRLSLKRWDHTKKTGDAGEASPLEEMKLLTPEENTLPGKKILWKIIISRIIFTMCLIFWVLLIVGNYFTANLPKMSISSLLIGGMIFTIIPVLIGILLEVSYYRRG